MRSKNRYAGIDSYALYYIRLQTTKLTGHPYFTPDDHEDIEQELVLDFILRWPDFDPARGSRISFIQMVVKRRCANLIEEIEALKRGQGERPVSLNTLLYADDEDDAMELLDTIANEEGLWGDAYLGWNQLSADLRLDLERAIATLPPEMALICEKLKTLRVAEVARELGIPRTTVNRAIERLRKTMGDEGLKIYL